MENQKRRKRRKKVILLFSRQNNHHRNPLEIFFRMNTYMIFPAKITILIFFSKRKEIIESKCGSSNHCPCARSASHTTTAPWPTDRPEQLNTQRNTSRDTYHHGDHEGPSEQAR